MPSSRDYSNYSISFPRFRGVTMWLVLIDVVAFFIAAILLRFSPEVDRPLVLQLELTPVLLFHGSIWQLFTYPFLDLDVLSLVFSSFMLYSFGSLFEGTSGTRRFLEAYFVSLVGGGLAACVISYTGILGIGPEQTISGAWPGIFGLVAIYGVMHAEQESFMFPIPVPIKAKYMTLIFCAIDFAFLLLPGSGHVRYVASLCGAGCGYLYAKGVPRKGLGYAASEKFFGIKNAYYKWKRRRAARKFEVYMRKHDRAVNFDQYGNYIPPDEKPKKENGDSGRGGWVN